MSSEREMAKIKMHSGCQYCKNNTESTDKNRERDDDDEDAEDYIHTMDINL